MDIATTRWSEENDPSDDNEIAEIVRGFLVEQARTAADQNRPLRRGTHAKGTCARAVFDVCDLTMAYPPALAARLAKSVFASPGQHPATVRFANSDPSVNSDWQPDVRGFSFAVEFAPAKGDPPDPIVRHDWALQSAPTLPFNDLHAFAVYARVMAARSEAVAVGAMSHADQLVFTRTKNAVIQQQRQPVQPYQRLRYWSNVPFRHGADDVVKYSASPLAANPACPLDLGNPRALADELTRHLNHDSTMSAFDIGVQFLDTEHMTYEGKHRGAEFWIENASVEWPEDQAPFHTVARLTLISRSALAADDCERMYIDVAEHSTPDRAPVGRMARARHCAQLASRRARLSSR